MRDVTLESMENKSVQNSRFVHHAKFHCIVTTLNRFFKTEFEGGKLEILEGQTVHFLDCQCFRNKDAPFVLSFALIIPTKFNMFKDLFLESRNIQEQNCAPIQLTVWPRMYFKLDF